MNIEKLDHLETLIGSLNKLILDAKNKGIIRNKELSLLNLIFKLLNNPCSLSLSNKDRNQLLSLYYKILRKYNFLCKAEITLSDYTHVSNNIKTTYISNEIIEVPDIIPPDPNALPPVLCETEKSITVSPRSKHVFNKDELCECFTDPNDENGSIKYMKILTLPTKNPFRYQGEDIVVGQIIDLDILPQDNNTGLIYETSISQFVTEDQFTYKVSTSSFPTVYSTETVTMLIKIY